MDRWPQRANFKAQADQFKVVEGIASKVLAERLRLRPSTLNQYLYNPRTRPSEDVLRRAAILFGCSILEFLDDPGSSFESQVLSPLTEQSRFFATLIIKDLKAEDLSDDDRRILFEDFQHSLGRLRSVKAGVRARAGGADADGSGGVPSRK
jgi:transcriptional regulator with XRE-family HTH domain